MRSSQHRFRCKRVPRALIAASTLAILGLSLTPIILLRSILRQGDIGVDITSHTSVAAMTRLPPSLQSIPRSMFFTYKYNILVTKEPLHLYENVMHTIEEYRKAWDDRSAKVNFLDDDQCRKRIQNAEPRLVGYFDEEKSGMYRGDICRVAALYLEGGYYFDVDLRVVEPIRLAANVTFASVKEAPLHFDCVDQNCPPAHVLDAVRRERGFYPYGENNLFQAFIASSPWHPVLKRALELMLDYYEGRYQRHGMMGVSTLGDALVEVREARPASSLQMPIGAVRLLKETRNEPHMKEGYYPDLIPQDGKGMGCKKICHDPIERKVYFYSRIPGHSDTCLVSTDNSTGSESHAEVEVGVAIISF